MVSKDADMKKKKKKKASVTEHHYLISPLHSRYEEELDRIRTEGDLTLIKVQTERKRLEELEAKLAEANKQLRDRKKPKQGGIITEVKEIGKGRGSLAGSMLATAGSKGAAIQQQLPTIQLEAEINGAKRVGIATAAAAGRQLHTEERLKVSLAERTVELQKLRVAIDETRRKRLDALATEKEMLKDIQEAEADTNGAQEEIAQLKRQATDMMNEIAAAEVEFDNEKHAFRLERQQLLEEVDGIVKTEKQGAQDQPAPVSHKYSVFHNNIAQRRNQQSRSCKWKKINLEQNIVSFEQKKRLLDRIVEETNVKHLSEFIQKYNDQERIKAEVFAHIESQTATNATLNESIAQLTEDISRLSGAGESDLTGVSEKPSADLQKILDADDAQIKRWLKDADIFAEVVKSLRDPIYEIHKEFFPNDQAEEVFDSTTTRESSVMMRRIGAIEERIMQFIMAKILEETESSATPNSSDTLKRLRQYQGRKAQRDSSAPTLSKLCGVQPPSTLKRDTNSQHSKAVPEVDDDDDTANDVTVIHSDVFRQRFSAASGNEHGAHVSAPASTTGSPTRKNATLSLYL